MASGMPNHSLVSRSLNIWNRKEEARRIERENHAFAKRLYDRAGCMNKDRLDDDF
jgi:hypothetical protein